MYWNNIPSPYFVERMNTIHRRGNVDIEAWFTRPVVSHRSWSINEGEWEFPYQYTGARRFVSALRAVGRVSRARPDVLVSLYESFAFASGVIAARASGVRVALHVMKVFDSWRAPSRVREAGKRAIFPRVDAIQVPGCDAAEYARQYGARDSQLVTIAEPVDVEHFRRRAIDVAGERAALGLRGCVFIYVGRLWSKKGLDTLLDAYERLSREGTEASLLIVGDGPDEPRYRRRGAALPNVVFTGFVQRDELPRWYQIADVFVFPTLGDPHGHVVQEAMASSLPVISSSAAGEITDRVLDGVTGFVVPPGNLEALHRRMRELADDPGRRLTMGRRGCDRIRPRTIDWWGGQFEQMVERLLVRPSEVRQP